VSKTLRYSDVYKNLDGMTALRVAAAMPMRKHKDEKDTAFVKRIVACYVALASETGVHDPVSGAGEPS
jgi:hypothetical protein